MGLRDLLTRTLNKDAFIKCGSRLHRTLSIGNGSFMHVNISIKRENGAEKANGTKAGIRSLWCNGSWVFILKEMSITHQKIILRRQLNLSQDKGRKRSSARLRFFLF